MCAVRAPLEWSTPLSSCLSLSLSLSSVIAFADHAAQTARSRRWPRDAPWCVVVTPSTWRHAPLWRHAVTSQRNSPPYKLSRPVHFGANSLLPVPEQASDWIQPNIDISNEILHNSKIILYYSSFFHYRAKQSNTKMTYFLSNKVSLLFQIRTNTVFVVKLEMLIQVFIDFKSDKQCTQ